MKCPSVIVNATRMTVLAGLMGAIAGVAHAQLPGPGNPGPGQYGGAGQGGAPAGQSPPDWRNSPMWQRSPYGTGFPADSQNNPVGQRDADGGLAGIGQYPPARRNISVDPQRTYGGAAAGQYPSDPRNTPIGIRGSYGNQGTPATAGSYGSYGAYGTTGGYDAGASASQSTLDSRNSPLDPLHTYRGPTADSYSSDSRNLPAGPQSPQRIYRPYGDTVGGTKGGTVGGRAASGTGQVPIQQRHSYGAATAGSELTVESEKGAVRNLGTKGKGGTAAATQSPEGAEHMPDRKTGAKGRAEAEHPASGSEPALGRQTDIKGGELTREQRQPALRNIPGGDRAQRARSGPTGTAPGGEAPEDSLKRRAPAPYNEKPGEGTGSVDNEPGVNR